MSRLTPFRLSLAALVVGLVVGTAVDPRPERRVVERGGWRVLSADFHVHTRLSDGFLSPIDVVEQAARRGLDVFALTEHNTLLAARIARWYSRLTGGPTVIIGEEVTRREFHLIGIGLTEVVSWDQSAAEIADAIHAQGGAVIAAHPVGRFWSALEPVRDRFDAVELMHPIAFRRGAGEGWAWSEMLDFYERARGDGFDLAPVGSSDYHFFSPLGVCRTVVFAVDDTAEAVVEAVGAGRTVVYGLDGEAWGDEALIELLEKAPLPERDFDYNYMGIGVVDRVARTLGWLGTLGLILFGPGRRRRTRS